MAKKKLIKAGDRTLTVDRYGDLHEVKNRIPNAEAAFAMDLITHWGMVASQGNSGPALPPGAVVERAFDISRLTFAHIKANKMDTPFPFAKVFPDDSKDA